MGTPKAKSSEPNAEVQRIVEEQKERDERIQKRLSMLKEQAKLAVEKCQDEASDGEEKKDVVEKLAKCENEICSFKNTIDSILNVTKETHNEMQKTKDIVANIQSDTSRLGGSFQSKFVEDEDEEMFRVAAGSPVRFSDLERTGLQFQQSPIVTGNDDEGTSNPLSDTK